MLDILQILSLHPHYFYSLEMLLFFHPYTCYTSSGPWLVYSIGWMAQSWNTLPVVRMVVADSWSAWFCQGWSMLFWANSLWESNRWCKLSWMLLIIFNQLFHSHWIRQYQKCFINFYDNRVYPIFTWWLNFNPDWVCNLHHYWR